jgi:hypothetical protein
MSSAQTVLTKERQALLSFGGSPPSKDVRDPVTEPSSWCPCFSWLARLARLGGGGGGDGSTAAANTTASYQAVDLHAETSEIPSHALKAALGSSKSTAELYVV